MGNKYLLKIFIDYESEFSFEFLSGIEEEGIRYEIKNLESFYLYELNNLPFQLGVVIKNNKVLVKSFDKNIEKLFYIRNYENFRLSKFSRDIGRFIKKLPLKGEWND